MNHHLPWWIKAQRWRLLMHKILFSDSWKRSFLVRKNRCWFCGQNVKVWGDTSSSTAILVLRRVSCTPQYKPPRRADTHPKYRFSTCPDGHGCNWEGYQAQFHQTEFSISTSKSFSCNFICGFADLQVRLIKNPASPKKCLFLIIFYYMGTLVNQDSLD